nr:Chain C, ASN-GLN-ARG-PHE-GLY-SER-ASN-ASN-THR-SER-GLY-SER [Homo sapiens]8EBM_D Chain D, ASN-GLN-ARG-PHE-GLY-SER-ASN-ASN-THR-SER-GLY-SER [Homo sapiens]
NQRFGSNNTSGS